MRNGKSRAAAVALAVLAAASPAPAADTATTEGIALRLVAGAPGADGRFRAALLVGIEPGWKTYWLDPGEAGLPPRIAASGSLGVGPVEMRFPAPRRLDDGFAKSIVYSRPVAVALSGAVTGARAEARLDIDVSLGLCRDVCVPVEARLETAFPASGEAPDVAAAFAALPRPSGNGRGILGAAASPDGHALDVAVSPVDATEAADLFVSGGKGWSFGAPERLGRTGGAVVFRLPVAGKPRRAAALPASVDAVLAGSGDAWGADALPVAPAGTVSGPAIPPARQGTTTP